MLPVGRFSGLVADNRTDAAEIIVPWGAERFHAPLLQLPAVVRLPYPGPAVLAGVLHRLGLDVIAAIGQILPAVDCDRALGLRRGYLESGRRRGRGLHEIRRQGGR